MMVMGKVGRLVTCLMRALKRRKKKRPNMTSMVLKMMKVFPKCLIQTALMRMRMVRRKTKMKKMNLVTKKAKRRRVEMEARKVPSPVPTIPDLDLLLLSQKPMKLMVRNAKAEKRKAIVDKLLDPNASESAAKRGRFEPNTSSVQPATNSIEAGFEEDVRRYLARKPMTTTEILRKMTQKRPNFPKEDIMPLLVNILKRINPHKQKIKGQMYLTIKTGN